ncbi:MAG: hypothetical protein Q9174_005527, partial [Haloplaca sp. 1 TL-2023]
MLMEPITSVCTAATIALFYVLCIVFRNDIANFLSHSNFLPPKLLIRRTTHLFPHHQPPAVGIPLLGRAIVNPLPTVSVPQATASQQPLSIINPLPTRALDPDESPSDTSPQTVTFTPGAPPPPLPDWTAQNPHGEGKDEYVMYTGNGSVAAGWPSRAEWMTYEAMFTHNTPLLLHSCTQYHVPLNSAPELAAIHNSTLLISLETHLDPRFILAIILQESNGCVRVPTSYGAVRNPGLMQDHNGPATCNEDATPLTPCPQP